MLQPTDTNNFAEFSYFGDSLIAQTRELVLSLWNRSAIHSELKDDLNPASEVELRCEEMVRQRMRQAVPSHGIIGQEFGWESRGAEFTWTIDPIDGAQNLINPIPKDKRTIRWPLY